MIAVDGNTIDEKRRYDLNERIGSKKNCLVCMFMFMFRRDLL